MHEILAKTVFFEFAPERWSTVLRVFRSEKMTENEQLYNNGMALRNITDSDPLRQIDN